MSQMKQCTKCGEIKSLNEFYKSKRHRYDHHSQCKECMRVYSRQYHLEHQEEIKNRRIERYGIPEHKTLAGQKSKRCTKCNQVKPFEAFYKAESGRYGLRPRCKECEIALCHEYQDKHRARLRIYSRQYHKEHRKERNAYNRTYYTEHREYFLAHNREYNITHREERRTYNREYHIKYRQERLDYMRRYRTEHPEVFQHYRVKYRERRRNYNRQWAAKNPDKMRAKWARRRASRMQASSTLTVEDEQQLYERYDHCLCCGATEDLTVDHIVPLIEKGAHSIENCQVLCRSCNSRKGTKVIDYRPDHQGQ